MSFSIGDLEVHPIVDIDPFALPLDVIPAAARPDAAAALRDGLALLGAGHLDLERAEWLLRVQSFLIRVDGLTILLDTCVGDDKERPKWPAWHHRQGGSFLRRLEAAGVSPDQVDVVMCSHLHADHVGWNTCRRDGRWVPTFPRARYLVARRELAHWQSQPMTLNHGAFLDSVLPLLEAGQLDTVEDGHELAAGVTLLPLPGHSPGQLGLAVDRAGAAGTRHRATFAADAIHTPFQVLNPDWAPRFDGDPESAMRTRLALLETVAEEGRLLIPAHFRSTGRVRIRRTASGFVPAFDGA